MKPVLQVQLETGSGTATVGGKCHVVLSPSKPRFRQGHLPETHFDLPSLWHVHPCLAFALSLILTILLEGEGGTQSSHRD